MRKYVTGILAVMLILLVTSCGAEEKDGWQEQYDKGLHNLETGRYQEAAAAFEAALEINDKRPEGYLKAADAYEALGDQENAEAVLRRGYEATVDETIHQRLEAFTAIVPEEHTETYWASFIGKPLYEVSDYLGESYTSEWRGGYAACFPGSVMAYCGSSYENFEPSDDDMVQILVLSGDKPVLEGLTADMTYPELAETVGQRGVQLEEPVYEEDAEDGSYYCYTVFTLDGYHLRYEWNEPEQEARRVTILSAPDEVVLTEEEAREIACDHWDYTPGDVAEDTGFPVYVVSGGLEQRSGGKNYYVFRAQWLVDNDHLSTLDAVIVDAKTGECLPYDE